MEEFLKMFNENRTAYYSSAIDLQPIMRQVYMWMGLGLFLSAVTAFLTVSTSLVRLAINPAVLIVAIIAEFALVMGISFGMRRMSANMAMGLFMVYAVLNGFTLSVVLLAFSGGTVAIAFLSTAGMFGAMSIFALTGKVDLTRMGSFLGMALIGLMIAMFLNIFFRSSAFDFLISIAGIVLFTGLTAYDTQRIAQMASEMRVQQGDDAIKFSIFGALQLYLDFINLFLFILRLLGGRRD
jgi:FtsH-binding integral membrane protein